MRLKENRSRHLGEDGKVGDNGGEEVGPRTDSDPPARNLLSNCGAAQTLGLAGPSSQLCPEEEARTLRLSPAQGPAEPREPVLLSQLLTPWAHCPQEDIYQ